MLDKIYVIIPMAISIFTFGFIISRVLIIRNRLSNIFVAIFALYFLSRVVALGDDYYIVFELIGFLIVVLMFLLIIYFIYQQDVSFTKIDIIPIVVTWSFSFIRFDEQIILINNISLIPLLIVLLLMLNRRNSVISGDKRSLYYGASLSLIIHILIIVIDGLLEFLIGYDFPKDSIITSLYSVVTIYYIGLIPISFKINLDSSRINRLNLTKREIEVVKCLVKGLSYKEVANKLFISDKTVKVHASNIYRKVEVSGRYELIYKLGND